MCIRDSGTSLNGAALFGALSNPAFVGLTLSQPLAFNDPNDPFTFTNNVNSAPVNEITDFGFSGQVDTVIGGIDTTAIIAYRENENFAQIDADFANIDFLGTSLLTLILLHLRPNYVSTEQLLMTV